MYDLVIIGSGPAGLSAAIYAKRACLNAIVIEKTGISGGQVLLTDQVDNYPGLMGINGFELGQKLREHADALNCIFEADEVVSIDKEADHYRVNGENGQYETKGVIIATGARHSLLEVPGEESLIGMGVSYCATCDGAFFEGKDVCVVGGGDVAVSDAIFLSRVCRKVYLIHRRGELRAAKSLQETMKKIDNIIPLWNCVVNSINGQDQVESVTIVNKEKKIEHDLKVSGIFIAVGIRPESGFIKGFLDTDPAGSIIAGEDGRTSKPYIYAAGDVRTKEFRQIITACSDGANAVNSYQNDVM